MLENPQIKGVINCCNNIYASIETYNGSVYESGYSTISLHKTKEGAEESIKQHKFTRQKYWEEVYKDDDELFNNVQDSIAMEAWIVQENFLID